MSTDLVVTELAKAFRVWEPGMVITGAGAYVGVPMEVYHGQPTNGPSISSSGLRTIFTESLAHYWDSSPLNPDREEKEQTEPMVLGRAAHHLLLGEAAFEEHFVIRPADLNGSPWHGNRKDCKQWLAERALEGLTVLKGEQLENVQGMERSLAADPIVAGGILNGYIEVSLFWKDEETGIWLKARPDAIPNDSGDVADLKCVADVSDAGIERGLGDRAYHQQGALVGEGLRHTLQIEMEHFNLVYVEQKRPNCVRIDEVARDEIAQGSKENRAALRLFARALETGIWPGPKNRMGDGGQIRRTPWIQKQAAERLAIIEQELAAP